MTWPKQIPQIPLAVGVPVLLDAARNDDPSLWERGVVTHAGDLPGSWWVHGPTLRPKGPHPEDWYIVDLTSYQGIGYAIWWIAGQPWMPAEVIRQHHGAVLYRFSKREIDDADRGFLTMAMAGALEAAEKAAAVGMTVDDARLDPEALEPEPDNVVEFKASTHVVTGSLDPIAYELVNAHVTCDQCGWTEPVDICDEQAERDGDDCVQTVRLPGPDRRYECGGALRYHFEAVAGGEGP